MKLRQVKGMMIDKEKLEKKKEEAEIDETDDITIIQVTNALKQARMEWERIKAEGKELREKELLDYAPNEFIK